MAGSKQIFLLFVPSLLCTAIFCASINRAAVADNDQPEEYSSVTDTIIARNKYLTAKELVEETDEDDLLKDNPLLEGDILRNTNLQRFLNGQAEADSGLPGGVSFDASTFGKWPNGVVAYTFAKGFEFRDAVEKAIADIEKETCIRLRPKQDFDRAYIEFIHGSGCYSNIGRIGDRQVISLGSGCNYKGIAIHEILHALGFFHEQSRLDRDDFIIVNYANIQDNRKDNFDKYRQGQASTLGEPYDKQSVMHYGNYAFSKNGQRTIISKSNPSERLGQRLGLSDVDIRQLNRFYECADESGRRRTTTIKPTTTTIKPTTTTIKPTTTTIKPTTITTTVRPRVCKDKTKKCALLSKFGLCNINFVNNLCKKSCKAKSCITVADTLIGI